MVHTKLTSYPLFMAIASLLYSVSEAFPIAGNEEFSANGTYSPFIPSRVNASSTLQNRSDAIVTATTAQIDLYTKLAGISSTAYCKSVVPSFTWKCTQCLKQVPDGELVGSFSTIIADTTGFVLVSDADKAIYLVFRGTNSIRQTIDDILLILTNYTPVKGTKVHTGFYASLKEAIPLYFDIVQEQFSKHPTYKVIVTGHSLGAAQALLAGLDLYQRDSRFTKSNLFIHTFGSPRVGDKAFAEYVESTGLTYTRSVHQDDIVPHVPSRAIAYLHAGVEIWAKTDSNIVVCTSDIESDLCSYTVPTLSLRVKDHLLYYGINEGSCL